MKLALVLLLALWTLPARAAEIQCWRGGPSFSSTFPRATVPEQILTKSFTHETGEFRLYEGGGEWTLFFVPSSDGDRIVCLVSAFKRTGDPI